MKNLMIVGAAGKQGFEYFTLLSAQYNIVALVDNDKEALAKKYSAQSIPLFSRIEDAVESVQVDVAILAVPHAFHFSLTAFLLQSGIHVIKEKPFALTQSEAGALLNLARKVNKSIFVITQRHSTTTFEQLRKHLTLIGRPLYFNYEFFMKLPSQTSGWRARREVSIGGVVLDMGYHAVDVLTRLFGEPSNIQTNSSYRYDEMLKEGLEDSSMSVFKYKASGMYGNLLLDRHSDKKHESLQIVGTKGRIKWSLHSLVIEVDGKGVVIDESEEKNSKHVLRQLSTYIALVEDKAYFEEQSRIHVSNTKTIETMYLNAELIFLPKEQSTFRAMISRFFASLNQPQQWPNLYAIRS